jgi:glycosyl transferase, family 25
MPQTPPSLAGGSDLGVDAVYVLTVKSFADRIAHATRELGRYGIAFEFVFDFDAADIDAATAERQFVPSAIAMPRHMSLTLKHMQAWRRACERAQRRILVFEDDAVLYPNFCDGLTAAMRAADALAPGWLVFLGGGDTKVPDAFFLHRGPLVPMANPTAEGYVTDLEACRRRIAWCERNKIDLPADHLIAHIDRAEGIAQYWPLEPLMEQGSVTGMFDSVLDSSRMKHSHLYNVLRNRWSKWKRRTWRKYWVRGINAVTGRNRAEPAC